MNSTHLAIDGIMLFAGFLKGVLGIGLPVFCMSFLTLLMSPAEAAKLLIIPALATNAQQAFVGGQFGVLVRRHTGLLLGTVIGTIALGGAIVWVDPRLAMAGLGVVLILHAAIGLGRAPLAVGRTTERWFAPAVGCATGVIASTTGVLSIPAVPFLQAVQMDRDELIQSLGITFLVSTLALFAVLAPSLHVTPHLVVQALETIGFAMTGMFTGQYCRRHLNPSTFRSAFLVVIATMGLSLLHRGIGEVLWSDAASIYDRLVVIDE